MSLTHEKGSSADDLDDRPALNIPNTREEADSVFK